MMGSGQESLTLVSPSTKINKGAFANPNGDPPDGGGEGMPLGGPYFLIISPIASIIISVIGQSANST